VNHDHNNRKCPLYVFDITKLRAVDLYDCKCPNEEKLRADNLQSELDEVRETLRRFKALLESA
jgi:hypothetical protein